MSKRQHIITAAEASCGVVDQAVPFSLICQGCDAGMDIANAGMAVMSGWKDILFDPDGLSWNYVGRCPDCWRDHLRELRKERRRINRYVKKESEATP